MKKIKLTSGHFAIVDDKDFIELSKYRWFADYCPSTKSFYAKRGVTINGKRTTCRMHREIMNPTADFIIDHINHDTLDNRRSNLRICSRAENCKNYSKPVNNATGYKGLKWHDKLKKWEARIMVNGKYVYLGVFKIKEEAALAYNIGASKYHGKFANINSI